MSTVEDSSGDSVVIGVLGTARIVEGALLEAARELSVPIAVVGSREPSRAREFVAEAALPARSGSYEEVVKAEDIQLIYNALPNSLHAPWTLRALNEGKHVLCEKPLGCTHDDAVRMMEAAEGAGLLAVEGYHHLYHPTLRRMLRLLEDGAIGAIRTISISIQNPPAPASDIRWDFTLGGGVLMDAGCYGVALLSALGSLLGGQPTVRNSRMIGGEDDPRVDAEDFIEFEFPSGATATLDASMLATEPLASLYIVGESGEMSVSNFMFPHVSDGVRVVTTGAAQTEGGDEQTSYWYQLRNVLQHLRGEDVYVVPPSLSINTARLIDASYAMAGFPLRASSGSAQGQ